MYLYWLFHTGSFGRCHWICSEPEHRVHYGHEDEHLKFWMFLKLNAGNWRSCALMRRGATFPPKYHVIQIPEQVMPCMIETSFATLWKHLVWSSKLIFKWFLPYLLRGMIIIQPGEVWGQVVLAFSLVCWNRLYSQLLPLFFWWPGDNETRIC